MGNVCAVEQDFCSGCCQHSDVENTVLRNRGLHVGVCVSNVGQFLPLQYLMVCPLVGTDD